LFGLMETSGSAMEAERMRAEVVAANMANAETTRTEDGGPYRRQEVVFAANGGDADFLDSMTDSMTAATAQGGIGAESAGAGMLGAPALPPLLALPGAPVAAPGVHIS